MAQKQPNKWHSKFKVTTEGFLSLAKVFYSLLTRYCLPEEQPAWTRSSMLPSLSAAQIGSSGSSKPKTNTAPANTSRITSSQKVQPTTCTQKRAQSLYQWSKQLLVVSINIYPILLFSVENNKWNTPNRIPKCSRQDKTQVHIQPARCPVCERWDAYPDASASPTR